MPAEGRERDVDVDLGVRAQGLVGGFGLRDDDAADVELGRRRGERRVRDPARAEPDAKQQQSEPVPRHRDAPGRGSMLLGRHRRRAYNGRAMAGSARRCNIPRRVRHTDTAHRRPHRRRSRCIDRR